MNNPRRYNLEEALNLSDIDYDIHLHDGLIDASNTALLFKKIKTEKSFKLNDYYLASNKSQRGLPARWVTYLVAYNLLKMKK